MSDIAKIKDEPNLVKDTKSGAILNTDRRGLATYRQRKAHAKKTLETSERLDKIEQQMALILQLLQTRGKE